MLVLPESARRAQAARYFIGGQLNYEILNISGQIIMDSVETLKSAWIFDRKGTVKETKKKQDKQKAKEIFNIANEALRYAPTVLHQGEKLKRISFMNGPVEWLITLTVSEQIIVMMKNQKI